MERWFQQTKVFYMGKKKKKNKVLMLLFAGFGFLENLCNLFKASIAVIVNVLDHL